MGALEDLIVRCLWDIEMVLASWEYKPIIQNIINLGVVNIKIALKIMGVNEVIWGENVERIEVSQGESPAKSCFCCVRKQSLKLSGLK